MSCHVFSFCLVRQVFKDLDFFGWYTTGGNPNANDVKIHRQVRIQYLSCFLDQHLTGQ